MEALDDIDMMIFDEFKCENEFNEIDSDLDMDKSSTDILGLVDINLIGGNIIIDAEIASKMFDVPFVNFTKTNDNVNANSYLSATQLTQKAAIESNMQSSYSCNNIIASNNASPVRKRGSTIKQSSAGVYEDKDIKIKEEYPMLLPVDSKFSEKDKALLKSLCKIASDDEDDNEFGDDEFFEYGMINESEDKSKKRGRRLAPNPDAAIIAAAIDAHLKKLQLDPSSKEGKRQRRRLRNRMSAQLHRERKKAYIDELEKKVYDRDILIEKLRFENTELRKDLDLLNKRFLFNPSSTVSVSGSTASSIVTTIDHDSSENTFEVEDDNISTGSNGNIKIKDESTDWKSSKRIRFLSILCIFCWSFYSQPVKYISSNFLMSNFLPYNLNEFMERRDNSNLMSTSTMSNPFVDDLTHAVVPFSQRRSLLSIDKSEDATITSSESPAKSNKAVVSTALATSLHSKIPPLVPYIPPVVSNVRDRDYVLWKYQSNIMQFYPVLTESTSLLSDMDEDIHNFHRFSLNSSFVNSRIMSNSNHTTSKSRKYLRSRKQTSFNFVNSSTLSFTSSHTNMENDINASIESKSGPVVLIPPVDESKTRTSINRASVSRILVTEGKTLLDPALAYRSFPNSKKTMESQEANKSNTADYLDSLQSNDAFSVSRVPIVSAPKIVMIPQSQSEPQSTTTFSSIISSTSTAMALVEKDNANANASNLLVMLVPATSVRWGKSWSDSSDNSMEWMLRALNYTSMVSEVNSDESSTSSLSIDDLWVEIGCSIFRAQLVNNVTLINSL